MYIIICVLNEEKSFYSLLEAQQVKFQPSKFCWFVYDNQKYQQTNNINQ